MAVPEVERLVLSTLASRLQRTEAADLPRLAGIDQADLARPADAAGRATPRRGPRAAGTGRIG